MNAARPAPRIGVLRVLYLSPVSELGGAERSLLELISRIPSDHYEAHLALPKPGPLEAAAESARARVVVVPWPAAALRIGRRTRILSALLLAPAALGLVPVVLRLARYVREHRIDLLHSNGTKAHLIGSLVSLATGRPIVWHLRDVPGAGPVRACLRTLGGIVPKRIIANSDATAAIVMGERHKGKIRRIYDGIDIETFAPGPPDPALVESLGIENGAFVVAIVGWLAPYKGHVFLIRAMPRVLEAAPEALLLIIGSEMYGTLGHSGHKRMLEQEAERLGVASRVRFLGARDDVAALYRLMDVFVLASGPTEAFGRVLVEAMASGKPVVATNLGGPREIVNTPDVGFLVPACDPAALSEAILTLYADKTLRETMGRAGRARVEQTFTKNRTATVICRMYEEMLGEAAIGGR